MELYLDCLPCLLRQVLEAARMVTDDEEVQEKIMYDAFKEYLGNKPYRYAPEVCKDMHAVVKKYTGVADPYEKIKSRDITIAFSLEPMIKTFVSESLDPMHHALKAAATGNVMDSAIYSDGYLESFLIKELEMPFVICDEDLFKKDLEKAKRIMIIGDNAGEAVFDKVLAQRLSLDHEVIYAVRDEPIINDVTENEARIVGLDDCTTLVSTGCGAPGAVLESCSQEFLALFNSVDIVISKGQGNFEALSETSRKVYFLLKAKCPKIAKVLGVKVSDYVFKTNIRME